MEKLHHFINGKAIKLSNGRSGPVFNPSSGDQIAEVPYADEAITNEAVAVALSAFPDWASTPSVQRARVLFKFLELMNKQKEEIAKIVTREHGKTIPDAIGSVTRGLEVVEFACGIPQLLKGEFSENVGTDIDSWSIRQPVGVCVGITPFNFPAMVPMWMFPIAIACGNTFILKPSEKDPSAPLFMAELLKEAGLPDGVFNIVNGDAEAVTTILKNPDVSAVSFVGSTNIAEKIYTSASANGKRVQALGGAKNHMIVMPDADMDQASDALMGAAFGSAGERCMAVSVAVAVGSAGDEIIKRLSPRVASLKVGPGSDPQSEMGPLITKQHFDKVKEYINIGEKEGAELLVDGRNIKLQGYENGYFLGGTLFDNVLPDMRIYKEEIFGPVLSVVRAKSFEEASLLVDKHEYGNGAAIFTRDGDAAREFSNRAQAGMIGINVPIPVPMAFHSFGGWKKSIFGDHSIHGTEGVHFYTKLKTVTSRWPTGIRSGAEYNFPSMK
ncbi:MAG: putative 3-oxopropanoate dehydrogenase [Alphaproteobacteria bacterium MarineAlpha2_Bin1]|nr:MAG: putative 3-oxopropanoate dehydrogenase [Alphaproteobacteria bacterium MarineAlpha2_Bin1]|tara:strand:- start:72 stop:1565 length:1494 start_codon:yes stop_codon:yes gene_type:complete